MTHLVFEGVHMSTEGSFREELASFCFQGIQTLTFVLVPVKDIDTFDIARGRTAPQCHDTPAVPVVFKVGQ